jgi:hypothetical protein
MSNLEPSIYCRMIRNEAQEGPTAFQAQFSCQAGAASDYFGLNGDAFQIDRDLFTVVPLKSDHDIAHVLALKTSSGYQVDDETFFRAFAASVADMLCRGGTIYDEMTYVVISMEQADKLGIAQRPEDGRPPAPYESYVVLEHRFSRSDYPAALDGSAT